MRFNLYNFLILFIDLSSYNLDRKRIKYKKKKIRRDIICCRNDKISL